MKWRRLTKKLSRQMLGTTAKPSGHKKSPAAAVESSVKSGDSFSLNQEIILQKQYEELYPEQWSKFPHNEQLCEGRDALFPDTKQQSPPGSIQRRSSLKAGALGEKLYVVTPSVLAKEECRQKEADREAEQQHVLQETCHQMRRPVRGGRCRRSSIGYDAPFQADPGSDDLQDHECQHHLQPSLCKNEIIRPPAQSLRRSSVCGPMTYSFLKHEVAKQLPQLDEIQQKEADDAMAKIRAFDAMLAGKRPIQTRKSSKIATAEWRSRVSPVLVS